MGIASTLDRGGVAAERARVLEAFAVSRETAARLDRFVALMLHWQQVTNLVASSTLPHLWSRHIGDSLQLLDLVERPDSSPALSSAPAAMGGAELPAGVLGRVASALPPASAPHPDPFPVAQRAQRGEGARPQGAQREDGGKPWTWADLGSGAGFPGMVIACALAEGGHACVHLIESNRRKAAFLREAARESGAAAVIHGERIGHIGPILHPMPDVITARALAPLKELCHLVAPILQPGAQALLMKGQDLDIELAEATKYWRIEYTVVRSRTDPMGRIMIVRGLAARHPAP